MGSPTLKSDKLRALLAKNIRAMLFTLQWSENELSRRSKVSQKQVNNIAMARTGCGIDALDAIAKAMAVEAWQLLAPGFHQHTEVPSRTSRLLTLCLESSRSGVDIEKLVRDYKAK